MARLTLAGVTTYSNTYGSVPASGRTPYVEIAEAVLTSDGEQIFIAGHAYQSTLTDDSNTYNIFLQKVKASDGTHGFTRHFGLDGVG